MAVYSVPPRLYLHNDKSKNNKKIKRFFFEKEKNMFELSSIQIRFLFIVHSKIHIFAATVTMRLFNGMDSIAPHSY